jgi:hypothetical protein
MADPVLEHLVTYIYKDKLTGQLQAFYPRTLAVQVVTQKDGTMDGHIHSNKHMTPIEADRMHKSGMAGGYLYLDETGKIPLDKFPDDFITIKVEAANIAELLTLASVHPGAFVMVLDPSDDETVESDWAVYRRNDNSSYDDLRLGWTKVFERESIDIIAIWDNVNNRPVSDVADIDDAVAKRHSHENQQALGKITLDSDGKHLVYDGQKIANMSDVTLYHFIDYQSEEIRNGDFWIKQSVGQSWWNDPAIEYGGNTMYERYMNETSMTVSPKVRTPDAVSFRRCFAGCSALETVQQYDTRESTDFLAMFKNCTHVETLPPMSVSKGMYFDEMFSGASSLAYSPEMDMRAAITLDGMFRGCVNMERVLPLGHTNTVTSMIEMFAGCSSLKIIDEVLDFSGITSAAKLENMFFDCTDLETLRIAHETLSVSLDLSDTALTTESILSVLDGLAVIDDTLNQQLKLNNVIATQDVDKNTFLEAARKGWTIVTDERIYYSDGTSGKIVPDEYEVETPSEIADALDSLENGDTLRVTQAIDTTNNVLSITNKRNITLDLEDDVVSGGDQNSGIFVASGSAILEGTGKIMTETPYDRNHGYGIVRVGENGSLTINGGGIDSIIEDDPINKGQFGIVVKKNAKLTINDGDFAAGWYCVAGNGNAENAGGLITINGGVFTSAVDYVIYHPQNGKLIINGGTFTGAAGALAANNGIIEINGGTFVVSGGGNTGEGGDGTSGLADVTINLNARYGDITCRITGGTFYATAAGTIMIKTGTAHNVDLKISGGRFTSKPDDAWIANGYICSAAPDEEGFYNVYKA